MSDGFNNLFNGTIGSPIAPPSGNYGIKPAEQVLNDAAQQQQQRQQPPRRYDFEDKLEAEKVARVRQYELEDRHGKLATVATQTAKGMLDVLLSPTALAGAAVETAGEVVGSEGLRDYGRLMGEAAQGDLFMQMASWAGHGGGEEGIPAATRTGRTVEEQQEAWPSLSTVSQIAGNLLITAPTLGAGGGLSLAGRAGLAATEGAAIGSQLAYHEQEPLRDVLTSTVMGAVAGATLEVGVTALGAGARKVSKKLGRMVGERKAAASGGLLSEGGEVRGLLPAPKRLTVEQAGGLETYTAINTLDDAQARIRQAVEAAGDSPDLRRAAGEQAREEISEELAKRARGFDPDKWRAQEPNAVQKLLYRKEILDKTSDDVARAVSAAKQAGVEIPDDLSAKALRDLAADADGPAATGLLQNRIEKILREIPETDFGDSIRVELSKSLEKFERRGRTSKVVKLIDAVEDELGPGSNAIEEIASWTEDRWHEVAKARKIRKPSQNTIGQVLAHYEYSPVTGRHKFALSELPDVMRQGHLLSVELQKSAQVAAEMGDDVASEFALRAQREIIDDLSSDLFGRAGRSYRNLWAQAYEGFDAMDNPAAVREVLRDAEERGILQDIISEQQARARGAEQAARELTGKPPRVQVVDADFSDMAGTATREASPPPGFDPASARTDVLEGAPRTRWATSSDSVFDKLRAMVDRAENQTTLDGKPAGRVFKFFQDRVANKVGSALRTATVGLGASIGGGPGAAAGNLVFNMLEPRLKKLLPVVSPAFKPAAHALIDKTERAAQRSLMGARKFGRGLERGAHRSTAAGAGALMGAFSLDNRQEQHDQRLEYLDGLVTGDQTIITDALQHVPAAAEAEDVVVQTMMEKAAALAQDMPKPEPDIRGPEFARLSEEQLQRSESMWSATFDPMSAFDEFEAGTVDPFKVEYMWRQWPGLQRAAQAGMVDMLTIQLTQEERAAMPENTLAQIDAFFGFGGRISPTENPAFSMRMSGLVQQILQNEGASQQQNAGPRSGVSVDLRRPTFTERVSNVRSRYQ